MSDRWWLYRGDQQIQWDRNDEPLALLTVFTEDDIDVDERWLAAVRRLDTSRYGPEGAEQQEADEILVEDSDAKGLFGYSAKVSAVRTRLALMGFTAETCRREFSMGIAESLADDEMPDLFEVAVREGLAMADMSPGEILDRGLAAYEQGQVTRSTDGLDKRCAEYVSGFVEAGLDRRALLALQLASSQDDEEVRLDLHDLRFAGYFASVENITQLAADELAVSVSSGGPIIVVTEGVTDAEFLRRALELVAPHVAHMFRFLDREAGAQMGAEQVMQTLRSFAAAGVTNRVIGVLDNDAAGRAVELKLRLNRRPATNRCMLLPDVPYGALYPTTGPSGDVELNINGRAVSIEFQFGLGQLRVDGGELAKVEWAGLEPSVGEYQGRLAAIDKKAVQANIRAFLADASPDHDKEIEPWPVVHALVDRLLHVAVPEAFPGQYYAGPLPAE